MNKSDTIASLAAALAKFQAEVKQPKKDADNPFFKSKYVPLEGVQSAVKEPMAKNGLSYTQFAVADGERIGVATIIMHESGEFIEFDPLYLPGRNAKGFDPQSVGSAITYGRRYSLAAALGISSEDDDDGNASSAPGQQQKTREEAYRERNDAYRAQAAQPAQQVNGDSISEKQVGLAKRLVKQKFIPNEVVIDALGAYNKSRIDELTKSEATKFIDWLNKYEGAQPTSEEGLPF